MILSRSRNFAHFKVANTGSTSREYWMAGLLPEDDICFLDIDDHRGADQLPLEGKPDNHMTAEQLRGALDPEEWRGLFKWAVERNPWDKVVCRFRKFQNSLNQRAGRIVGFGEFVTQRYYAKRNQPGKEVYTEWCDTDQCHRIIVDRVVLYEHTGLREVLDQLEFPEGEVPRTHKHTSRPMGDSYKPYYGGNRKLINTVRKDFEWEIDQFGYTF